MVTALGLAGLVVYLALRPEPGVTRQNFQRLRQLMSEAEAEAVLGGPGKITRYLAHGCIRTWEDDGCQIQLTVYAGQPGPFQIVAGQLTTVDGLTQELPPPPEREGLFDKVRRWLRL